MVKYIIFQDMIMVKMMMKIKLFINMIIHN